MLKERQHCGQKNTIKTTKTNTKRDLITYTSLLYKTQSVSEELSV